MTDRKDIHHWNDGPVKVIGPFAWWNPLIYVSLLVDLVILTRWWLWHRRQSAMADRWRLHHDLVSALRDVQSIKNQPEMGRLDRERAERVEHYLWNVVDELELQSEFLDRERGEPDE